MQPEIEAKFLNIDHNAMRQKLKDLDARLAKPQRIMRRTVLDYPDGRFHKAKSRLRVRDEGDKITVTFKSARNDQYSNELETTVGAYAIMVELLTAIGLEPTTTQESKRETWYYKGAEVVLDEWPHVRPFMEIEATDEPMIRTITEDLGLAWKDAVFGSAEPAYRAEYPGIRADESLADIPGGLLFDTPLPAWLKERREAA